MPLRVRYFAEVHSFIHGGAWRDPDIDSMSFAQPAIQILSSGDLHKSICGFASINYRLSPYQNHSSNPSSPDDPSRNAKHPDHVVDLSMALAFLDKKYNISRGYLLVGHSAGATLAFQIQEQCEGLKIPQPLGILGVSGIYDLEELIKTHNTMPVYKQLVINAFGEDQNVWKNASPTSSMQPAVWEKAKALVLAHSAADELVDICQPKLMFKRVRKTFESIGCADNIYLVEASGFHDEIWKEGHELARLVGEALAFL